MFEEYSGPLNHKIFEFMDSLQMRPVDDYESPREEQGYKSLPDHKDYSKLEKECGAKLFKGLSEIMTTAPKGTAKQKISELHAKLRDEYPQFAQSLKL